MRKLLQRITSHALIRGSTVIFIGSTISNAGSYLYHLLAGRILGPVGYGELASLISLLYIFGVPMTVLQTVMTKYFSQCKADHAPGEARDLYVRMMHILIKITCISFFIFIACTPFLGSFLNLTTSRSLLWIFCIIVISIFLAVNISVLQGFQLFLWVSVFNALGILFKLVISTPLAFIGVEWAMIGSVIASLITFALLFIPITFIFTAPKKSFSLTKKDIVLFSMPTFMTLLGYTSLYSTDIMLARHFLSAGESGLYSAIATLGKVIFYASSAIVIVLFPVLSERTVKHEPIGKILTIALSLVGIISMTVSALYFLVPELVIQLLFGASYKGASPYLGLFACFISLYSLGNVYVLTCLAVNKLSIWILTASAAIIQTILITLFHTSIMDIIIVNISVTVLFVLSAHLYYSYGKPFLKAYI